MQQRIYIYKIYFTNMLQIKKETHNNITKRLYYKLKNTSKYSLRNNNNNIYNTLN